MTQALQHLNKPWALALGQIPGVEPFELDGYNPVSPGSSVVTTWDIGNVQYPFPAAPFTPVVKAINAADAAAGLGAQSVLIEGLDANYEPISEIVATDGINEVAATKTFFRINNFEVATAGAVSLNFDLISLLESSGGTVIAGISAITSKGGHGVYTVPAGRKLHIVEFEVNCQSTLVMSVIAEKADKTRLSYREIFVENVDTPQSGDRERSLPWIFDEKSDIELRQFVLVAGSIVRVALDGFLTTDN